MGGNGVAHVFTCISSQGNYTANNFNLAIVSFYTILCLLKTAMLVWTQAQIVKNSSLPSSLPDTGQKQVEVLNVQPGVRAPGLWWP